ncbi:hypothetical protein QJS10_CPA05g00744 [Acorus calamus]|uniref:Uncharacterized protein n=1 Tax=Acorus calamus TaxID=4465 RepID=A0AAV9ETP3_ACOCL|nr:hypothetical protein QJS10_CPA05g00744 [Acorus calamus]
MNPFSDPLFSPESSLLRICNSKNQNFNRYFCLMVPLTLPLLVTSIYIHWLSMKLFKHV